MADSYWIHALQELSGMLDLMVSPSLRFSGCTIQSLRNILLARLFKILTLRESILLKTLPVVSPERGRIGNDPRLHCLHHEVDSIIGNALEVPSVGR